MNLWELGFPVGPDGKESVFNTGYLGLIPGKKDSLEKKMATHSSILAWTIPWTEDVGGLQSMETQRVGHNRVTNTLGDAPALGTGLPALVTHTVGTIAEPSQRKTPTRVVHWGRYSLQSQKCATPYLIH